MSCASSKCFPARQSRSRILCGSAPLPPLQPIATEFFFPLFLPKTYVRQGMPIGYQTDYYGEKVRDITSPISGVVAYIGAVPSMKKGDTVANIAALAGDPQH